MKKLMLAAFAALTVLAVTGCGSSRTPRTGNNSQWVHYNTFFGISIESLVCGDGLIVQ